MPKTLLTDIAVSKITQAAGTNSQVAITHVALGDGNGANYDPQFSQTALKRERTRKAIERRHIIDPNVWRVNAEFGPDTDAFAVREIGFFDGQGNLIAIWAGLDVQARETGVITYLVDHVLSFSRIEDGVVIVDAPDDELYALALSTGVAITQMQMEQLRQADRIRAEHGAY